MMPEMILKMYRNDCGLGVITNEFAVHHIFITGTQHTIEKLLSTKILLTSFMYSCILGQVSACRLS